MSEMPPPPDANTPPTDSSPNAPETPPHAAPPGAPGNVSPPGNVTVGLTFYDLIAHHVIPLLLKPYIGIPVLALVIAAVTVLFMYKDEGITYETPWVGMRVGGGQSANDSPKLKQCMAQARKLGKPYAIETINYLIQFEKEGENAIRQSRRIFYTLRSLRTISSSEEKIFVEGIHTHDPNAKSEHWSGTEKEVPHVPNKWDQFNVKFDMDKDDVRSVVTGANFVLSLPFEARQEFEGQMNVLANQDFQAYPDTEDAICELNMIIESKTLQIKPVGDGAKRYFNGNLKSEEAKLGFDSASGNGVRTISARWRNLIVGDTVGIHFEW